MKKVIQITTPCDQCPLRRDRPPGLKSLGYSPPEVYIGQAVGRFWVPCHKTYEPGVHPKAQMPHNTAQCAGMAIYRANCGIPAKDDGILELPPDKELVFGSHEEFHAHHRGISVEESKEFLSIMTPEIIARFELGKASVRVIPSKGK